MRISPFVLTAFAICSCNGEDTRAKRIAAIEEVEKRCGLPPNTFNASLADKPANEARACDPRKSGRKCYDVRHIDLGYVFHKPLLCKMECVKRYKSKDGYQFGLYLNSVTPKDAPRCDNAVG